MRKKIQIFTNEVPILNLDNDQVFRAIKKKWKKKKKKGKKIAGVYSFINVHMMWSRSIDFEYDINLDLFFLLCI